MDAMTIAWTIQIALWIICLAVIIYMIRVAVFLTKNCIVRVFKSLAALTKM